jgi:uncharacterized protein YndB with AHSA1/START domain
MITVTTTINASVQKVWNAWNQPEHITQWYFASEDWHAPRATNELNINGKFCIRMEAKDGSFGFDLVGVYDEIETNSLIKYHLEDGRNVEVYFSDNEGATTILEKFDPESLNTHELQQQGWQMILNNFKKYVESI